jgi:hypothetical protein
VYDLLSFSHGDGNNIVWSNRITPPDSHLRSDIPSPCENDNKSYTWSVGSHPYSADIRKLIVRYEVERMSQITPLQLKRNNRATIILSEVIESLPPTVILGPIYHRRAKMIISHTLDEPRSFDYKKEWCLFSRLLSLDTFSIWGFKAHRFDMRH